MIKKLLLALGFLFVAAPAFATCTNPITISPGSGSNQGMSVSQGPDGNCQSNVTAQGQTAVGSAAANPPVLVGGTADGTATGTVQVTTVKTGSSAGASDKAVVVADPNVLSALNTGNGSLATIASNTGAAVPTGTNIIGKVGIDQTTPGTTNGVQLPTSTNGGAATVKGGVGVVNGGSIYNTIAASTSLKLSSTQGGGTGAIGDYVAYCTIIPSTTSPGAVTLTDGSGSAITIFAGGSSSVSNLVPFSIPLGLVSISGGWTLTTLTNETAICGGKFT